MCRVTSSHPPPVLVHPIIAVSSPCGVPVPVYTEPVAPTKPKKALVSILRTSTYAHSSKDSVTDLPRLVAHSSSVSLASASESSWETAAEEEPSKANVGFIPSVQVREFRRSPTVKKRALWYTSTELRELQIEAAALVREYDSKNWLSSLLRPVRVVHTHPALSSDNIIGDEGEQDQSLSPKPTVENQIQSILLIDSHSLCLDLFNKAFRTAFPHATVHTAKGSQEALEMCQGNCYDIVLVEERLSLFWRHSKSGSSFLRSYLSHQTNCRRQPLCIGVSAHIDSDRATLKESGADICWSKPPPPLNVAEVNGMFQAIVAKRGCKRDYRARDE